MDYKSAIEEQIRELQKVQDQLSKIENINIKSSEMCHIAETITNLAIKASNM